MEQEIEMGARERVRRWEWKEGSEGSEGRYVDGVKIRL